MHPFTSHLLLALIAYWLWMEKSLCAPTDEELYQDLLSGNRTLVAVGKVKDRVVIVIQPKNGNVPLNDTYVFEAAISNDDYTELVLQNGTLIQTQWPNAPALTQPLLTAFFLRDERDNHFLVVCQKDPQTFIDCKGIQVDNGGGGGSSTSPLPHPLLYLSQLKEDWSPPYLLSDTGKAFSSFRLYDDGPDRVELFPYGFKVDNLNGVLDDSLTWDKGLNGQDNYILCHENNIDQEVTIVNEYPQNCNGLGWGVVSYAFFDEHHSTFFAQGGVYRIDRLVSDSMNQHLEVTKFAWPQYFRLGNESSRASQAKKGLSVGVIIAIVLVIVLLVLVVLGLVIFYLMSSSSTSNGGTKSQKSAGKKAAAAPQQSKKKSNKGASKK